MGIILEALIHHWASHSLSGALDCVKPSRAEHQHPCSRPGSLHCGYSMQLLSCPCSPPPRCHCHLCCKLRNCELKFPWSEYLSQAGKQLKPHPSLVEYLFFPLLLPLLLIPLPPPFASSSLFSPLPSVLPPFLPLSLSSSAVLGWKSGPECLAIALLHGTTPFGYFKSCRVCNISPKYFDMCLLQAGRVLT